MFLSKIKKPRAENSDYKNVDYENLDDRNLNDKNLYDGNLYDVYLFVVTLYDREILNVRQSRGQHWEPTQKLGCF